MAKEMERRGSAGSRPTRSGPRAAGQEDPESLARATILERVSEVRILEPSLSRELIRRRQELGLDKYDEMWDGVYVMPPLANNPHQTLVSLLLSVLQAVVMLPGRGLVLPGANVSDRRHKWEESYRVPDVVVVLPNSRAIDCVTHWFGGPDFLIEIQSPDNDTEDKIPFFSRIKVRELLIIHRDSRQLRLFRHDGEDLIPVEPTDFQGKKWLVSTVIPLAFRRPTARGNPRTEVVRTDDTPGHWTL
jgi:Uma2 family endonuclease